LPRKLTGQLILRPTGYYGRFWAIVDGERIRVTKALDTTNRQVAKLRLERMMASAQDGTTRAKLDPNAAETFLQAAERIFEIRRKEGKDVRTDLPLVRNRIALTIGSMSVLQIESTDINSVYDAIKLDGLGIESVRRARHCMRAVFRQLKREGTIKVNPVDDATLPQYPDVARKERAVLTDAELGIYLAWQHPKPRYRTSVRERQTMSCLARMFGGLRTGDLHALQWERFDVEQGGFTWGYAPREKTRQPQLLEVPELLRPILRDWWQRAGSPTTGPIFPVRKGDRAGERRKRSSHAAAFRADLMSAFEASSDAPLRSSQRWRTIFEETEHSLPADFHSWRRSFAQALADADVTPQQSLALTGHSDMAVHARYLRSSGKMRRLPDAALPKLPKPPAADGDDSEPEKAPRKGRGTRNQPKLAGVPSGSFQRFPAHTGDLPPAPCDSPYNENTANLSVLRVGPRVEKAPSEPFPATDILLAIERAATMGDIRTVRSLVTAELRRRATRRSGT